MRIKVRGSKLLFILDGSKIKNTFKARSSEENCNTCRHFLDYRASDDIPGEANGYCAQLVNTLGLDGALKENEYGGHWTRDDLWCDKWERSYEDNFYATSWYFAWSGYTHKCPEN